MIGSGRIVPRSILFSLMYQMAEGRSQPCRLIQRNPSIGHRAGFRMRNERNLFALDGALYLEQLYIGFEGDHLLNVTMVHRYRVNRNSNGTP